MQQTCQRMTMAALVALGLLLIAVACVSGSRAQAQPRRAGAASATTPITHVVIFMLENHNFSTYFGQFPGVQHGVSLPESPNPLPSDLNHSGPALAAAEDGGKMDEFNPRDYIQYSQADLPIWWAYAQQFGLSDTFFSSINSNSTPNHIALIAAGQSGGIWDTVASSGCGSVKNQVIISRNTTGNEYWSYPCYSIPNIPQLLASNGLTWRYYNGVPVFDGPSFIQPLFGSSNDIHNPGQFLTDIQKGNLPTVSWVVPGPQDHPPVEVQAAQNWVSQQINALMQSSYWPHTAIFISWDDWGGMYDPVDPPQLDGLGLGPRVPLLVISPYARAGYLSHQTGEFSSFAKFIEANWGLPNLGQRDALSSISDLTDFFDFSQASRAPVLLTPLSYQTGLNVPNGVTNTGLSLYGCLNPRIGGTSTNYNYSIVYTLSGTPTTSNITIDGVSHSMTNKGAVSLGNMKGTLYQYSTKLGVGNHSYSFSFSTPSGLLTLPYNGVPFSGPEVHPFALISGRSTSPVLPSHPVTYSVKYVSPQNRAPTLAEVDVDGVAHAMSGSGTTYASGVIFTYTTSGLASGQHYYRFRFDDGTGPAIYEGGDAPNVTPLTLTNSSVSPTSGTSTTTFTFSITYTDAAGNAPAQAQLYVDQQPYPMSYISGSFSSGALYQASLTLASGSHTFDFVFSDGTSSWAAPIAPAVYKGPSVSILSGGNPTQVQHPSPASTSGTPPVMLPPSHDDDPDYPLPGDFGS